MYSGHGFELSTKACVPPQQQYVRVIQGGSDLRGHIFVTGLRLTNGLRRLGECRLLAIGGSGLQRGPDWTPRIVCIV